MRFGLRISSSIVALGLVLLALGGCGGSGPPSHSSASVPPPAPGPPSPPARAKAPGRPARGGRAELAGLLRHELAVAGPASGAYVYDLTTGREVFSERAGIGRPPASVEKLYTSVALLTRLGPGAHLHTSVLGTGSLGPGGVWDGDLYLRGGGDPTLASPAFQHIYQNGYGALLPELVSRLHAAGIRRVSGSVIGDGSRYSAALGGPTTKYGPDLGDLGGELGGLTFNHGASGGIAKGAATPGAYAAAQFALALHAAGIEAVPAAATARTPAHARVLASVSSPPLSELLRLMNVPSDDFYAEMLTEELGARFGATGSIPDGTHVIADALATYGIHPTVEDGSGLSREDRSSPREVVELLRAMAADQTLGPVLSASLPLVGVNGTTRRIAKHTVAQGRCVAKTGTLDLVTNLAGYCNAAGHQQVAFAIFDDGPPNQTALVTEGRMVADIVRLDAADS
jgi:D-alanyl-D-alanine carboxypeptidase/D-alanyl-D-alanine-endopeptidase (penicillin-binding protein 4)